MYGRELQLKNIQFECYGQRGKGDRNYHAIKQESGTSGYLTYEVDRSWRDSAGRYS